MASSKPLKWYFYVWISTKLYWNASSLLIIISSAEVVSPNEAVSYEEPKIYYFKIELFFLEVKKASIRTFLSFF